MNTAIQARVRAASAEMNKPGRWRLAFDQLLQASAQILADPEPDFQTARFTLDTLHLLYQWSPVMPNEDMRRLNSAVLQLSSLVYQA